MGKVIEVTQIMFSKSDGLDDMKIISFATNCLTILLPLNISTVESLKNKIKWNSKLFSCPF